jgi:sugar/nucleoside kinase (ribokinase family)
MANFAEVIQQASGRNCNIELAIQDKKIGGNGPIMAMALAELGHPLSLAGAFGKEKIDPIFEPLTQKCQNVFSFADAGHSDALEFPDGKIILGKMKPLQDLTYSDVIHSIGEKIFLELLEKNDLFVSANWTMLPMTNSLWRYIIDSCVPRLTKRRRYMFVDLADPAKRNDEDLKEALALLSELNKTFSVVLGLNYAESLRIGTSIGLPSKEPNNDWIKTLYKRLNLSYLVIHNVKASFAINATEAASHTPIFNPNPKIKTGAGDNFNAGFCHALLKGLSLQEALASGNATAGFYIQEGRSPSIEELAIFCRAWDNIKV